MLSGWIFSPEKSQWASCIPRRQKGGPSYALITFQSYESFSLVTPFLFFFCVKWMSWNKTSVSTDFCQTTAHPQCGWKNETSASFALTAQRHRAFCGFCQHAHNDSSCQPRSTGWQQILFYWGRAELHHLWSQEPTELLWTELQLRAVLKILI